MFIYNSYIIHKCIIRHIVYKKKLIFTGSCYIIIVFVWLFNNEILQTQFSVQHISDSKG